MDGRVLQVKSSQITKPNEIKIVENEGMKGKGHLYIKFNVKFPDSLTNKQRNDLKTVFGGVVQKESKSGAIPVIAKQVNSSTGNPKEEKSWFSNMFSKL